ncbi:glycosyltransferase involved in cell wall biosynthesis [Thiohalophilus thiocyanatoxydans]|uniref:Glycosyltransferase involved in cell wall biosynthesis n=1 Tax=Thiohalophilus thiocyanatoxydans TaxID=381308 RepID=A0A4R8IG86_9GAMM|nr:glycosyltransferase involved in cell wall biosynthesis [Thiohalophilus thiocyanatoxydans]
MILSDKANMLGVVRPGSKLSSMYQRHTLGIEELKPGFKPFPLLAARKLAKIIDRFDADIIHAHWVKDLPLASLAKRLSRKKPRLVFTRHMKITRYKNDIYHTFFYKNIDLVLAITRQMESDLRRFLPAQLEDRILTHYHGVPEPAKILSTEEKAGLREKPGIPAGAFLAGIFGRIKDTKGQYLVIEAIRKLHAEGHYIHGLIVGHPMDDRYLELLKQEVNASGLSDYIKFMDFVEEPQSWMQVCDVVILASHEETFGLVLVEAMRAGVAVIGSDSGGVPEIIEHDLDGLLFRPADSQALAGQLRMLVDDPQSKKRLAAAGKAKAERVFDQREHFRVLYRYFTDLAGSKRAGSNEQMPD